MLTQLSIQNFGLIDQLSVDLDSKLNILTGKTGAGKSIVIGALRSVLGERISVGQLRDDSASCVLEAVFDLHDDELLNLGIFEDFLSDGDSTLIIHRTFNPDGRNKIKINGMNVTVGQLKEVGNHLIDFHGPHDHQMLLSVDSHIKMLDRLVDFGDLKEKYSKQFNEYSKLQSDLAKLQEMSQSRSRELDMLTHQVKELEQVSLVQEDYDQLVVEQTKISNAEKLFESASKALDSFESGDQSINDRLRQAFSAMNQLQKIDEQSKELSDLLDQIQSLSDQYTSDLRDYASNLSFEPHQAQEINDRYQIYQDILRKYGPSLLDAQTFYEEAKTKLDALNNFEQSDAELRKQIQESQTQLQEMAKQIRQKRQKIAKSLKKTIESELKELGIANVKFEARINQGELNTNGFDEVIFYISPNAGEDLKPLSQIVSSGEAARVMLALKKALVDVDPIPVLIFDEIDAQIGGRLGTITGQKLKEISNIRQVILITHLPQIASFADNHLKINKIVKDGRALTTLESLDQGQRVDEIAQMMSGKDESDIAVQHAQDLLANAQK